MATNAISAQGATLQMSTGAGGAKNITAAAAGNPTILTSSAHGLSNGDVVVIASITGTIGTDATNGLNGKTFVVRNVTTNTFAVDANTTGLAYTSGGTATPQTFTAIAEFKSYALSEGQNNELEATHLASTTKEKIPGLPDLPTLSISVNQYLDDTGQAAVRTAFGNRSIRSFKIVLPSGTLKTGTVSGFVKSIGSDGKVDSILEGKIDIACTSAFVWS